MTQSVALFHTVYGLRSAEAGIAEYLRDAGHTVVLPDLFDGRTATTLDEGFDLTDRVGWDAIITRGRAAVRAMPADTVLAGVSMGAAVVEGLLPERPHTAGAFLLHNVIRLPPPPPDAVLRVQTHRADPDPLLSAERLRTWEQSVRDTGADAQEFTYPGVGHFFTDPTLPDHDPAAAALVRTRLLEFLGSL